MTEAGVLYNLFAKRPEHPAACRQLVVPQDERQPLLKLMHGSPLGVHFRANKLFWTMRTKYFWPEMYSNIDHYVRHCYVCAKFRRGPLNRIPLHPWEVTGPMQRVEIGFMGRLPTTTAGNNYILVMIDTFTKFAVAEPMPTCDAVSTACEFVHRFVNICGVPEVIVSDRGSHFTAETLQEALDLLGIDRVMNAPYHHETSGQVENFNKTLRSSFTTQINRYQDNWDTFIQASLMPYR